MSTPGSRPIAITLGTLVAIGAGLRLREYLANRPLWIDEAMLALDIGRRGYLGLLSPLDYDQVAAPLFLWVVKTISLLGGMGELALRLFPLLAGALLPWILWRAARSLAGPVAGVCAAALAALSVPLIFHSAELKPYALDALVSAAVILATLGTRAAPERREGWVVLLLAGLLGTLLSIPVPLIMAGAIAGLLADPRARAAPGFLRRLLAVSATWAASVAALYGLLYRGANTLYLRRFWSETLLYPGAADGPTRFYHAGMVLLDPLPPLEHTIPLRWCVLLAGVAALLLVRRAGLPGAFQIGVPFLALLVASGLGLYPIEERLVLFLAPCLMILVGVLLAELLRLARQREPAAAVAGALLIALWGGPAALANARNPQVWEMGRLSALRVLRSDPSDPVYIIPSGIPAWAYYTTDWTRPDTARLDFMARMGSFTGPAAINDLVEEASPVDSSQALVWAGPGRLELLGARTGVAFREPGGFAQTAPDSGWARRETDRIVRAARPHLWVYGVHWVERELPDLEAEFARRGIVIVDSIREIGAAAIRIRIPPPGRADSAYRAPAAARP